MSTDIATRTPQQETLAQIRGDEFQQQLADALPENVSVRRFVRATATALIQNPDVVNGERASLFQAVIRSAQDGLIPDGREAALVVFGGKVTYLPMIGGFRKIAAEHGWTLRTAVVYEHDYFEHEAGLEPRLVHRPVRVGELRGKLVAAYAIASHRDGRAKEIEVLYEEDIAKVKKASRSSSRGPWVEWEDRMWEKTAGRRLFAKLPISDTDRVVRVLEASALTPAEATAALYGHPHPPVHGELPPVSESRAAVEAPAQPSTSQQAAPDAPSPSAEGAAPDPDDEPVWEDDLNAELGEPTPEQAAATVVALPQSDHAGKSLQQMLDNDQPRALAWFKWAANYNIPAEPIDDPELEQVRQHRIALRAAALVLLRDAEAAA